MKVELDFNLQCLWESFYMLVIWENTGHVFDNAKSRCNIFDWEKGQFYCLYKQPGKPSEGFLDAFQLSEFHL